MSCAMSKISEKDRSEGFSIFVKYAIISSLYIPLLVTWVNPTMAYLHPVLYIPHSRVMHLNSHLHLVVRKVVFYEVIKKFLIIPCGWSSDFSLSFSFMNMCWIPPYFQCILKCTVKKILLSVLTRRVFTYGQLF